MLDLKWNFLTNTRAGFDILTVVSINGQVFMDVVSHRLVTDTDVSEGRDAFAFTILQSTLHTLLEPESENNLFLRNVGICLPVEVLVLLGLIQTCSRPRPQRCAKERIHLF